MKDKVFAHSLASIQDLKDGIRRAIENMGQPFGTGKFPYGPVGEVVLVIWLMLLFFIMQLIFDHFRKKWHCSLKNKQLLLEKVYKSKRQIFVLICT